MSVVACKITKNGYEMVSDSITVRGYSQTKGQNSNRVKLIEINGVVVGSVGRAEESSLFQLFLKTHTPASSTESGILDLLSEFHDWKYKKINSSSIDNEYLIGFEGNVFRVEGWLVEKIVSYSAIGAGSDFANATMHLGHSAKKAVETAIELSIYCENPIIEIIK